MSWRGHTIWFNSHFTPGPIKRTWNVHETYWISYWLIYIFLRFRNIQRWRNMVIDSWTYVWLKWIKTIFLVPRLYNQRKTTTKSFDPLWYFVEPSHVTALNTNRRKYFVVKNFWSTRKFSGKNQITCYNIIWSNLKIFERHLVRSSFLIHLCLILFDPFP